MRTKVSEKAKKKDIVRYIVEMTGLSRSWAYREIKKLEI
jgi:predicted DNA-binding transcriptional regulator AlpA